MSESKLILPASVIEHPRIVVAEQARNLSRVIAEHNLSSKIEQRQEELSDVLRESDHRISRLYAYHDHIFGADSEEGSVHLKKMYAVVCATAHILGTKDEHQLRVAGYGAVMHDAGKLALPDRVEEAMVKGEIFTPEVRQLMKVHVLTGYQILTGALKDIPDLKDVPDLAYAHHEECDGLGYLCMVKEEIPLVSMIISVVDSYLAIARKRNYDPATPHEATLEELRRCAGLPFDEKILAQFNQEKLYDLKARCQRQFSENWEHAYREALYKKLDDNTRQGRRLPQDFESGYPHDLYSLPTEQIEHVYMNVRLAPENKYMPQVVEQFIKCVLRYPNLVSACLDQGETKAS